MIKSGHHRLRWILVVCQTAVVGVTWPLWSVREFPPNLPVAWNPFGSFDVGWLLLITLIVVVARPLWGVVAHAVVLLIAMCMDQTRIQPQVTSLAILLVATLPSAGCQLVGRVHLVALWFYAGFHKLLSAGYYGEASMIQNGLRPLGIELAADGRLALTMKIAAAVLEVAIAVLLLMPGTRRAACVVAAVLHTSILISLTVTAWNPAVWSWNLAVVIAAFVLFWNYQRAPRAEWEASDWKWRVVVVYLLVAPLGFYFELTDTYLAHCLYSQNKLEGYAIRLRRAGESSGGEVISIRQEVARELRSPLPPERRLLKAYFMRRPGTRRGDLLQIKDIRLGAAWRDREEQWFVLTEEGTLRETIPPKRGDG